MIRLANDLWKKIRSKHFPKRLYQYGTIGLSINDDRTRTEKVCDNIDAFFERHMERYKRKAEARWFKSFYDFGTGQWITDRDQMRKVFKGKSLLNREEWEREGKRIRAQWDREDEAKYTKKVEEVIRDVKQGRSFIRERREQQAQLRKEWGC